MRKHFLFYFSISILFSSCAPRFTQVIHLSSRNVPVEDNTFIFDNDTIKVSYSFWKENGVISFEIQNKLNVPIYIDWKNSAFILNDKKLDYWRDETQTESLGGFREYSYDLRPGPTSKTRIRDGVQVSSSKTTKPERIAFIPPNTKLASTPYYLTPNGYYFKLNLSCKSEIVPRNNKPKQKTTVHHEDYSASNSPLIFRNYLSISFAEDSKAFYFIDNEFYAGKIEEMDSRHFIKKKDYDIEWGEMNFETHYESDARFYIMLSKFAEDVKFRRKYDIK